MAGPINRANNDEGFKSRGGLTRGSGFTESVRTLWVHSMHASATYHNALSTLAQTVHKTSNQHEELSSSHKTRDFADLSKLINWFEYDSQNPFDPERTELVA